MINTTFVCLFVVRILLYLCVDIIHYLLANLSFPFCKLVYKFVNLNNGLWKGEIYLLILLISFSFVMDRWFFFFQPFFSIGTLEQFLFLQPPSLEGLILFIISTTLSFGMGWNFLIFHPSNHLKKMIDNNFSCFLNSSFFNNEKTFSFTLPFQQSSSWRVRVLKILLNVNGKAMVWHTPCSLIKWRDERVACLKKFPKCIIFFVSSPFILGMPPLYPYTLPMYWVFFLPCLQYTPQEKHDWAKLKAFVQIRGMGRERRK